MDAPEQNNSSESILLPNGIKYVTSIDGIDLDPIGFAEVMAYTEDFIRARLEDKENPVTDVVIMLKGALPINYDFAQLYKQKGVNIVFAVKQKGDGSTTSDYGTGDTYVLSGEVKGNHVLILDDIVDTAESTEGTIEAVKRSSNSDEIQFTVVSPFAKAEITDPGFEKEDAVVILRNKGIPVYKIGEDENQGGDRVNDIVYYYTEKVPGIWLNAGAGMASDKTSPQKQRRENTSLNPNFTKETEVPTLLELAAMDPEMQAKVLQRMARFDALERLTGACITGSIGDMDEYEKFLLSIIGKENIDEDQLFNTIFAMVFIQYRRQVEEAGGQKSSRPLILEIGEPAKELFENRKAA